MQSIFDPAVVIFVHTARVDEIPFRFLSLPLELQIEAVNYLEDYSDLKALRLTSKQLSDIATPRFYYEVDLRTGANENASLAEKASRMRQRINSLLLQPANLLFVRKLKTPPLRPDETQLLGQLLPLLRRDSLTRFKYFALSKKRFPTPTQMKFIWNHQKKLQNQRLYWHMVPSLESIVKECGPSEVALLKSFTMLDISVGYHTHRSSDATRNIMSRSLKVIDLSILQKLRVWGSQSGFVILPLLNTLFANESFINLKKIFISNVFFEKTVRLTKLPLLNSLALEEFGADFGIVPLEFADDIKLSTFTGRALLRIEEMTPILAQIKGLESLHIKMTDEILSPTRAQRDFINAIIRNNQDTLSVLNLELKLQGLTNLFNSYIWEFYITKDIQYCKKLVTLSLPRIEMPINCYCELIAALPNLETLTIHDFSTEFEDWSQDDIKLMMSASSGNLKAIFFASPYLYNY